MSHPKPSPEAGDQIILPEGGILFEENDQWNGLYYIIEGQVEIYRERGRKLIPLTTLGEGDFIGTATLFTRAPRLASARAANGTAIISHFPANRTEELIKQVPTWAVAVMKDLVRCLRTTDDLFTKAHMDSFQNPSHILPVQQLLGVLLGFCTSKDPVKWVHNSEIQEMHPVGDLPNWFSKAIGCKPEDVERSIALLKEQEIALLEDTGKYGLAVIKPNIPLMRNVLRWMNHEERMPLDKAEETLRIQSTPDTRAKAKAAILLDRAKHL